MMEKPYLEPKVLAQYIDHTCLRPDAKETEISRLCDEARAHQFKAVCVELKWLPRVVGWLGGTPVKPITVVSFPQGNSSTVEKCAEAKEALAAGAQEIDMVMNRDRLKGRDYSAVVRDIEAVVALAKNIPVKVIIETSELSDEEKVIASVLAKAARAQFVKTSTGFSRSGATVADVKLMRRVVGSDMGVKASGGIRSLSDALAMIEAGASRIGSSSGVKILKEMVRD